MDATSYSITAKPWKCQHTPRIHLANVYEQETKDPSVTDEDRHMGAADLVFEPQDPDALYGVYWTKRSWITGLYTAGHLKLRRAATSKDPKEPSRKYALDERNGCLLQKMLNGLASVSSNSIRLAVLTYLGKAQRKTVGLEVGD